MGSHSRPKGHARRNVLLGATAGGLILTASQVGGISFTGASDAIGAVVPAAQLGAPGKRAANCEWGDDQSWGDESDDGGFWGDDPDGVAPNGDAHWGEESGDHWRHCEPDHGPGRHRGKPAPEHGRHEHRHHHGKHRRYLGNPREIAKQMIGDMAQYSCFDHIVMHESKWNPRAYNRSGAYGIPQALPGRRMASEGRDWRTNPKTQIRWGYHYMEDRYGSPCRAWAHWRRHHNY